MCQSESVRVMFIVCVYLYCCSKYQKGDRLNCLMIWGERLLLFVLMILVELLRSLIKLTFINVLLKNDFTNIRKLMNKLERYCKGTAHLWDHMCFWWSACCSSYFSFCTYCVLFFLLGFVPCLVSNVSSISGLSILVWTVQVSLMFIKHNLSLKN